MITDKVRIAGISSYLRTSAGSTNLSSAPSVVATTAELGPGQYWTLSGLSISMEGPDLGPLFRRQANPILAVRVIKELFPSLFANAHSRRVHTVAGFADLREGTCVDCRVQEVDGVATLVSTAPGACKWKSPRFALASDASLVQAAWSLAPSRQLATGFAYQILVRAFNTAGAALPVATIASGLGPADPRRSTLSLSTARTFEVEFRAKISVDGDLHEHHVPLMSATSGRALLRSVSLLEEVPSPYEFYSLQEMVDMATRYEVYPSGIGPITRLVAVIPLGATLVGSSSIPQPAGQFESVAVAMDPGGTLPAGTLSHTEARLIGHELSRANPA